MLVIHPEEYYKNNLLCMLTYDNDRGEFKDHLKSQVSPDR